MSLQIQSKSTILIQALARCNMIEYGYMNMLRRVGVKTHEHMLVYRENPSGLEELVRSGFKPDRTNCVITKTDVKTIINTIDQIQKERTEQFRASRIQCGECESTYELSMLCDHGKNMNHCYYIIETKNHTCNRKTDQKEQIYHVFDDYVS